MTQGGSMAGLALLLLAIALSKVDAGPNLQPKAKLTWHFYKTTNSCRYAEEYVKHQVKLLWDKDRTITPKLVRLLQADCFSTGCDASVLLMDVPNPEKNAPQNRGLGGFAAIDKIKQVLEARCPKTVSCADILNLATRDAVHLAGAPSYPVYTGRRDGMSSAATVDLPSPSIPYEEMLAYFESKGLNVLDMTTLLGAHTTGRTHCSFIVDRLYNYSNTGKPDPSMSQSFLTKMRSLCPPRTKKGQTDPIVSLNPSGSAYNFTESYYSRVLTKEAVLGVDQQLLYGEDSLEITKEFAAGLEDFRKAFAESMSRMGTIGVLTGKQGQIRTRCSAVNK